MSSPPDSWLDNLRVLVRQWLGAAPRLVAGWPRESRPAHPTGRTAQGVWLALRDALEPRDQAAVWVDAGLALAIVDRSLGGDGTSWGPGAHPAARLRDAELGVLAYVAARALTHTGSHFTLEGIAAEPPSESGGTWLCWPCQLHLGDTTGSVHWWTQLKAQGATGQHRTVDCRWVIGAEPRPPFPLCPGDVWTLEGHPSPNAGWLRVTAPEAWCAARWEGPRLVARRATSPRREHASLELSTRGWTLAELSALDRGEAVSCRVEEGPAQLWQYGHCLAQGELVTLDGHLGLRIDETVTDLPDPSPRDRESGALFDSQPRANGLTITD